MMKLSPEIGQLEATCRKQAAGLPQPALSTGRSWFISMTVGICFLVPLDNPYSTAAVVKERLL